MGEDEEEEEDDEAYEGRGKGSRSYDYDDDDDDGEKEEVEEEEEEEKEKEKEKEKEEEEEEEDDGFMSYNLEREVGDRSYMPGQVGANVSLLKSNYLIYSTNYPCTYRNKQSINRSCDLYIQYNTIKYNTIQ